MRLILYFLLAVLLITTVLISIFFDNSSLTVFFDVSNIATYIRIISILWLILAIALALGYKRRIEMSQKYRQADQVLAESKAGAKRKERTMMLLEEKLKAGYDRKADTIRGEMDKMAADHKKKMLALKAQNLQLKDAVSKMLKIIKKRESHQVTGSVEDTKKHKDVTGR